MSTHDSTSPWQATIHGGMGWVGGVQQDMVSGIGLLECHGVGRCKSLRKSIATIRCRMHFFVNMANSSVGFNRRILATHLRLLFVPPQRKWQLVRMDWTIFKPFSLQHRSKLGRILVRCSLTHVERLHPRHNQFRWCRIRRTHHS